MKISINREGCIGCATCEALCPQVFKMLEDGKSGVVETYRKEVPGKGEVEDDLISCVESAKETCPVQVISIE